MTERLDGGEPQSNNVSEQAARSTLALNPLVGVRGKDLMDSAAILLKAVINEPTVATSQWLSFLGELGRIGVGESDRAPQAGDKRFADMTWKNSALIGDVPLTGTAARNACPRDGLAESER